MAANLYLRGRTWWWRWRPSHQSPEKLPITLRISLRTGCADIAQRYAVQLEAQLEGYRKVKHFQIGREGLGRLYKSMAEQAIDRISGDRLSYPSPFHDRIDLAHARMYALSPTAGELPSRSLALEILQAAGLDERDILDVITTIEAHEGRSLVTDGQLAVQLKSLGYPANTENLARVRSTATAAMAEACLSSMSDGGVAASDALGVAIPPAMNQFGSLQLDRAAYLPAGCASTSVAAPSGVMADLPTLQQLPNVLDGPVSEVAKAVIKDKIDQGLWDEKRAKEVRATVRLFVAANGDLPFSSLGQHHLASFTSLMTRLPKGYNHFMVKGQGGFTAALEAAEKLSPEAVGLHSGTRNKHLTWFGSVVKVAAVLGYSKLNLEFAGLRHGAKEMKKRDKRKKDEKRPAWDIPTLTKLLSGPVYDGCVGINRRLIPGPALFHDGMYWVLLIATNICGRPSEAGGLELADIV